MRPQPRVGTVTKKPDTTKAPGQDLLSNWFEIIFKKAYRQNKYLISLSCPGLFFTLEIISNFNLGPSFLKEGLNELECAFD